MYYRVENPPAPALLLSRPKKKEDSHNDSDYKNNFFTNGLSQREKWKPGTTCSSFLLDDEPIRLNLIQTRQILSNINSREQDVEHHSITASQVSSSPGLCFSQSSQKCYGVIAQQPSENWTRRASTSFSAENSGSVSISTGASIHDNVSKQKKYLTIKFI